MICSVHIELFVGVRLLLVQTVARSDRPLFFLMLLFCDIAKSIKATRTFKLDCFFKQSGNVNDNLVFF